MALLTYTLLALLVQCMRCDIVNSEGQAREDLSAQETTYPIQMSSPVVPVGIPFGLGFVAPSSYGYGGEGVYGQAVYSGEAVGSGIGPRRYAFPIFDYGRGLGGFGGLGYFGYGLGFNYPGYGHGHGLFRRQ